ncbi:MAG: molybdate ABC transporter permease subunit [Actinobacteria bacterium]|nr:molybdate ABC transporter permease subunit [Actinomycetota bacterium]
MRSARRNDRRRRASATPKLVAGVAFITVGFFTIPLVGLLGRASWSTFVHDLSSAAASEALRLSLLCSFGAMALSVCFGMPLAWWLARTDASGRALVRALVLLPMVLPPVVGGVALLSAFGRNGVVGAPLWDWFGIQFTFTTLGVVLAETFVALPFFVITAEAALRSLDGRFAEAASTLGASPGVVFRRVTLPLVAPSLVAGAVLSWARALGEFGATMTFAGNIAGETRTLPLAVYLELDTRPDVAVALSLVLVAVSLAIIVALRDRWSPVS